MADALLIALVALIVLGIASAVSSNKFYGRLAETTGSVSTNEEVLETFLRDPRGMPRANAKETTRRLKALIGRQPDPSVERLRRIALTFTVADVIAFVAFAVIFLTN